MATIQTAGQLAEITTRDALSLTSTRPSGSLALYNGTRQSYAQLVKRQPNVRTVISFIARNIAQLGVHLYEYRSETDRVRVRDHAFADALRKPNPADRHLTTYRLMHRTVWDTAAYDIAFWAVLPLAGMPRPLIQPLRPDRVEVFGSLWPTGYRYHGTRGYWDLPADNVVYFQNSHDLDDPVMGTSPIETLRRILAEEDAAGVHREQFWRSGARVSGFIERDASAPDWSEPARDRFMADFRNAYTGYGEEAAGVPLLEDGMKWKEGGNIDARSAQYVEGRKLSREEAAATYHIDPIWVGISEGGAAFASVKERHKALYQDTLGPWVSMLEQDLTTQALPVFEEDAELLARLYTKINVAEKLRGSTEDLADAVNKLTGRPVLTANEGRALLERNDLPEGEGLAIPLNLTVVGGAAGPAEDDGAEPPPPSASASRRALSSGAKAAGLPTGTQEALQTEHVEAHRLALKRLFDRQRREVLGELSGAKASTVTEVFDVDRWNAELENDLLGLSLDLAADYAPAIGDALAFDDPNVDNMVPFLSESARIAAENINATTADQIEAVFDDEDTDDGTGIRNLFDVAAESRAETSALTRFTALASFVALDVASQAGRPSKVWVVTSSNSRHPELDGETAPLGEPFSNGMAYPGDAVGGADQTAGCTCLLEFE